MVLSYSRGWFIKNATGIFQYSSKMIGLIVKTQARGQDERSRAFKWGIVCFCNSNNLEDMIKNKKYHFS